MPDPPPDWPDKANPNLMTVGDVARRLNVSDGFVYVAIADGRMSHHRLGKGRGGIRVSEEQLAAFLRGTARGGEGASVPPAEVTPPPNRHLRL